MGVEKNLVDLPFLLNNIIFFFSFFPKWIYHWCREYSFSHSYSLHRFWSSPIISTKYSIWAAIKTYYTKSGRILIWMSDRGWRLCCRTYTWYVLAHPQLWVGRNDPRRHTKKKESNCYFAWHFELCWVSKAREPWQTRKPQASARRRGATSSGDAFFYGLQLHDVASRRRIVKWLQFPNACLTFLLDNRHDLIPKSFDTFYPHLPKMFKTQKNIQKMQLNIQLSQWRTG